MVKLPHTTQQKHAFLIKNTRKSQNLQNQIPKKKVFLELLHQKLGNSSTRSLMEKDTSTFWKNIHFRIDTETFCTSCQISTLNKKTGSNTPLNPKTPFKWVFMDIIPAISSKILTKDTTFANYLLIIDAYPKLLTLFGMENVTNKDVMDKLDMFQERFEKVDEFVWWYLE